MLAKYFGDLRTQRDIHKSVLYKRRQSVQSTNSKTHLTTKQHGKLILSRTSEEIDGTLPKNAFFEITNKEELREGPRRTLLGVFYRP